MFTSAGARASLRCSRHHLHSPLSPARTAARRNITTKPPHLKSRTWKNSAVRWGLAAAGIYYYNTSPIFADRPQSNLLNPDVHAIEDGRDHQTLDQLTASSRNRVSKDKSVLQSVIETSSEDLAQQEQQKPNPKPDHLPQNTAAETASITEGASELEEEAGQEGAFNPVTGEINWDCPCLGGMAYGPCGPQFKAAFSCFVYSTEEPKGMECIDKFQNMQDCFREHPEVYKDEIEDNQELDEELAHEKEELQKEIVERRAAVEAQQSEQKPSSKDQSKQKKPSRSDTTSKTSKAESQPQSPAKTTSHTPAEYSQAKESEHGASSRTLPAREAPKVDAAAGFETDTLVPKAAHDATDASTNSQQQSVAKS